MRPFRLPAAFNNVTDFNERLAEIDLTFRCSEHLLGSDGPMGKRFSWCGRSLANRWAIHPMEGWDGMNDGMPSSDTLRRWHRFGRSGAALIWGGEAFAVCAAGRANPFQLHQGSNANIGDGLAELVVRLRAGQEEVGLYPEETLIGLQLTHSGRWSKPASHGPAPRTIICHDFLDKVVGKEDDSCLLSDEELSALPMAYATAARLAQLAGFDFVDVKCCHGYLLHESLAAHSRPGIYGGSFENRTRLFKEIILEIKKHCPGLGLGVRLSATDTIENGFSEAKGFLALLQSLEISMVNLTQGSPYYSSYLQRPAAFPPSDAEFPARDPLYEVWHHLKVTREMKSAYPELLFVGTGYTYLQEFLANVAEHEVGRGHVDFVGLGRMALSYPDFPRDHLSSVPFNRKQICRTFSDCTTAPRNGMRSGCYPLDPAYLDRPEAKIIKDIRANRRSGK